MPEITSAGFVNWNINFVGGVMQMCKRENDDNFGSSKFLNPVGLKQWEEIGERQRQRRLANYSKSFGLGSSFPYGEKDPYLRIACA